MKRYLILIPILFCALVARAQSNNIVQELVTDSESAGVVRINQPKKLESLVNSEIDKKEAMGYRILVYSGNNSRQAREEANSVAAYLRKNFPGGETYVLFQSPFRVCLYGDFLKREDAEKVVKRLKATKRFKYISIRRGLINVRKAKKNSKNDE